MQSIDRSEITPEALFLSRRALMRAAGLVAGSAALAACMPGSSAGSSASGASAAPAAEAGAVATTGGAAGIGGSAAELAAAVGVLPAALNFTEPTASSPTDETGDALNKFDAITGYNNYYEFTLDKEDVAPLSQNFTTFPWQVEVTGMANRPTTFKIEDLIRDIPQEERIYRLRCVEAWSMVIPWVGFPLSALLERVEPTAEAKFVHFTSVMRPEEMPGQNTGMLDWPYTEGLRLDEAMHNLTILATGMYGKLLTPQQGAPLRLVVPWKYGFKSIKGIVRMELTDKQPVSTWEQAAPREYGFYANVNPAVDHPRWTQSTERRIGETGRRASKPFNGYGAEVASLYEGMDLEANF
ncbi:MAG: protein-methionine-sulfoxide reductase catalytic subunit MsrP [Caldilineaceae bacterium]